MDKDDNVNSTDEKQDCFEKSLNEEQRLYTLQQREDWRKGKNKKQIYQVKPKGWK